MAKFKNKYRIESHRTKNWDYSNDALYFITIVTQNRVRNLGKIVKCNKTIAENNNDDSIYDPSAEYKTELSEFGKIVEAEWHKSFEMRDEFFSNAFIIMPDHLHAIVGIYNPDKNSFWRYNPPQIKRIPSSPSAAFDLRSISSAIPEIPSSPLSQQTHRRASPKISPPPQSLPEPHGDATLGSESHIFSINEEISNTNKIFIPPTRLPNSISSFIAGFKSGVNTAIDNYIDQHNLKIPKYNRKNHFFQPNYHDRIIGDELEYMMVCNYIKNNPAKWAAKQRMTDCNSRSHGHFGNI